MEKEKEKVDLQEEDRVRYSAFDVRQAVDAEVAEIETELETERQTKLKYKGRAKMSRQRLDEWRRRYEHLEKQLDRSLALTEDYKGHVDGYREHIDEWRRRYDELKRAYEQGKKHALAARKRWYHWRDKSLEKQKRISKLRRENRALIAELKKERKKEKNG